MILNAIGIILIGMFLIFNILLFVIYRNVRHIYHLLNVMLDVGMKFKDFKVLFDWLKERWSNETE